MSVAQRPSLLKRDIEKERSEQSRYEIGKSVQDATDLYEAIEKEVLPWIKSRW